MATQQQFIDFLKEIEPSPTTKSICISAHSTLRGKLEKHETYRDIYVNTYLSGSYARNTALRPRVANGTLRRPDVDIIVVTNHTLQDLPSDVIAALRKAVKSLGYTEVEANRRSKCVSLGSVEMDVVPVIANPWEEGGWLIADKSEEQWLVTKAFTFDQAYVHATTQHFIEQPAKEIAVPKAAVSIFGKGRVIGDFIFKA
ncbi:hypothetical protein PS900_00689 [Pseudomonas fluorescens]|uniref:Nucleotidyltransferase n=1 Tax=Pseudomonas fluorescens TaxID=294 RepID=A0A8H2RG42_PSEFL|nr:hypothetical protein PS900_00689 [Pseudomonas fluorescens]